MEVILNHEKIKDTLKDVIIELFKKRREEFIEVWEEVSEDYLLGEVIKDELETEDIQFLKFEL